MNILFINSVCGIRSTGRIVTEQAEKYMAQGHTCRIAYGRETVPDKYKAISYRIGTEMAVRINGLKARLLDNEGLNARSATKRFIEWANSYDPDVLWLHNLHGYYIHIGLLFDWIKSRPHMQVRWTLHDCWAFTGHCAYFTAAKCDKWKTGCTDCPQKKSYPTCYGVDGSSRNYEKKAAAFRGVANMTLVTPSKWLADLVKESFLKEYPVEVRHNTINEKVFCPTPGRFKPRHGLQEQKVVLGVAGVWDARKGLTDFLKLAEVLDETYTMVLVGVDRKQQKQLPKGVVAIPRTNSPEELAEIYSDADVFVNPTYEDNYPTVNLEAQACGTSVVTYDTGGCRETLRDERSLFVPTGDLRAVAAAIERIVTAP